MEIHPLFEMKYQDQIVPGYIPMRREEGMNFVLLVRINQFFLNLAMDDCRRSSTRELCIKG
jgi:hypothetical protein